MTEGVGMRDNTAYRGASITGVGFTDFSKGLIDVRYLFYFLSVIAFCLFATNAVLQSKRA